MGGGGGFGPHHRRPNRDRQPRALECPDDDRVGAGPKLRGDPPRGEALGEHPEHAHDQVAHAEGVATSALRLSAIEQHHSGFQGPLRPLTLMTEP
jgi:hypothetical protein